MDNARGERNGTPLSTFERGSTPENGARAAAGWFPDPAGIYSRRYWDGGRWTDHVVDRNGVGASHPLHSHEPSHEVDAATVTTEEPLLRLPLPDATRRALANTEPDIDLTADERASEAEPEDLDRSAAAFATRVLERACVLADIDCQTNAMTADDAIAALPDDLAEATVRVMHRTYAAAGDVHNAAWAQTKLDEIRARLPVEASVAPVEDVDPPDDAPVAEEPAPDASAVPAAWYRDPSTRHQHRYWDGATWADRVADEGVEANDPLRWDPPAETSTETPDARVEDAPHGGVRTVRERIRSMRTFWIISTVVFTVLTVGYLLLPVSESATSIDGAHTVSLHCGSVISPQATATRGADITNASSICSAARHSNTTRVYLFAALALVSVALAAFAKMSSSDEPEESGEHPSTGRRDPRSAESLVL